MRHTLRSIKYKMRRFLLIQSLLSSNNERCEKDLKNQLVGAVPDISKQYSSFTIDMNDKYIVEKVRCQHTFQMSIAIKAIGLLNNQREQINIVDIGDSAGTHLQYLNALSGLMNKKINSLSINLDSIAVEKIKSKGLKAVCCRAEELHALENGFKANIFMSFEMLEHLFDPISFLHNMAIKSECDYFVATVPYIIKSRVGLYHIRNNISEDSFAENTHIFELCPEDWNLIFKFSGWEIVYSDRYTQYPKSGLLNLMKYHWRKYDFDGFYGVILKKNLEISDRYKDW